MVSADILQASIVAGDLTIFDRHKKPQPGDVCIGPIGQRLLLLKIASKTYDKETSSFETAQDYPIPEELTNPEIEQELNWYPLAYDVETEDELARLKNKTGRWSLSPQILFWLRHRD
jgi:hypothetical protein